VARPRAADDFAVIPLRMEELRRERAGVPPREPRRPDSPRPYVASARPGPTIRPGMAPMLWRMLSRGCSA
jgi:hypothetical protein